MSYTFQPDTVYRMPTHFGPATGPRQGPGGRRFDCKDSPKNSAYAVSFLSRADQLARLLPPGFALEGEPVVTVTATYMKEIQWLAGRGYNMLGISFAAAYQGQSEITRGNFLAVLWENLTEPIITGREELGYSKIYCELPEPAVVDGRTQCVAHWMGFRFAELEVDALQELSREQIEAASAAAAGSAGTLHYKYMPRTSAPGVADAAYAVLTPAATPNKVVQSMARGRGAVKFHRARWEDMPTQYMIVNALADLEVVEPRGAVFTRTVGGKDLSDMRIL